MTELTPSQKWEEWDTEAADKWWVSSEDEQFKDLLRIGREAFQRSLRKEIESEITFLEEQLKAAKSQTEFNVIDTVLKSRHWFHHLIDNTLPND